MTDRVEPLTLRAGNRMAELARLSHSVNDFLDRVEVEAETRYAVNFALEELFSNIVKYAFADGRPHRVELQLRRDEEGLVLTLEDDGQQFDPMLAPPPDISLPLQHRPIGGLGLFLLRQLGSRMDYQRLDGRNRVTVHFDLPAGAVH